MGEINYEEIIGQNIKKERLAKGMSQNDLGKKCDIVNTVISAYENKKKQPGLNTIVKIAKALDVSIDKLCYGDESISFINSAPDEGRKIVNCIYTLWELGVINYYENFLYSGIPTEFGDDEKRGTYLYIIKYDQEIKRLINSLREFSQRKETFPDPDMYLENILSSVANEINNQIAKENEDKEKKIKEAKMKYDQVKGCN